jgi:hypothetical protein
VQTQCPHRLEEWQQLLLETKDMGIQMMERTINKGRLWMMWGLTEAILLVVIVVRGKEGEKNNKDIIHQVMVQRVENQLAREQLLVVHLRHEAIDPLLLGAITREGLPRQRRYHYGHHRGHKLTYFRHLCTRYVLALNHWCHTRGVFCLIAALASFFHGGVGMFKSRSCKLGLQLLILANACSFASLGSCFPSLHHFHLKIRSHPTVLLSMSLARSPIDFISLGYFSTATGKN